LVCETLGVTPVIFEAPAYPMNEALLYLGDKILNPLAAAKMVLTTLPQVNRLYLDLVPSAEEMKYLSIVAKYDHIGRVLNLLASALPEDHEMFSRLVLIADAKYTSKFTRIAPGSDLRSIVLSEHEIVMDGIDTSDPAIQKVLAWKLAEGGLKVVSIGTYLAGSKSMVSVPQALQILSNGKGV
jgi:hypothetical protein